MNEPKRQTQQTSNLNARETMTGSEANTTKAARHVLVTGGAGFIGSHLVERLLLEGKAVVVVDDLSTGSLENLRGVAANPRLRVVTSKISRCPGLGALVAEAEAIYHLAAAVGVELVV